MRPDKAQAALVAAHERWKAAERADGLIDIRLLLSGTDVPMEWADVALESVNGAPLAMFVAGVFVGRASNDREDGA